MSAETSDSILYPEYIRQIPVFGGIAEGMLRDRIDEGLEDVRTHEDGNPPYRPSISVVVRTLNEALQLDALLGDIAVQENVGETEIIIVDNESVDNTRQVAKKYGAEVVRLARKDFTYPRSMNLGVAAASNDLVFLTVGHVNLSNRHLLQLTARHFNDTNTGGVFSHILPGYNASRTEKALHALGIGFLRQAHEIKKAGMGVLGASNCLISREIWRDLGMFDEDYEIGGEDTKFACVMLQEGLKIIDDPVSTVHHSHNVGPINYFRQVRRWSKSLKGPNKLEIESVAKSRPDLNFN